MRLGELNHKPGSDAMGVVTSGEWWLAAGRGMWDPFEHASILEFDDLTIECLGIAPSVCDIDHGTRAR